MYDARHAAVARNTIVRYLGSFATGGEVLRATPPPLPLKPKVAGSECAASATIMSRLIRIELFIWLHADLPGKTTTT